MLAGTSFLGPLNKSLMPLTSLAALAAVKTVSRFRQVLPNPVEQIVYLKRTRQDDGLA